MKYRTKPDTIEAVEFLGPPVGHVTYSSLFSELPDWVLTAIKNNVLCINIGNEGFLIRKSDDLYLEGKTGDYIIRGVDGSLYPCKPDVFNQSYDCAEEYHEAWNRIVVAGILGGLIK